MLNNDLAELYGVSTKRLNEQVKRNVKRFKEDFMFRLTREEYKVLRSQIATLKVGQGRHSKYIPYVFTEHGALMLASVLNSDVAIQMSVFVIRAFVKLREMLLTNEDLKRKIEEMEKKYDHQFLVVFDAIKRLLRAPKEKFTAIEGFVKK